MNSVEKIISSGQCIGCGLCEAVGTDVGVKMDYDAEGFLRPVGTERLAKTQIATIMATCRAINSDYVTSSKSPLAPGESHDAVWGSFYSCKTGHSTDKNLRHLASSGGAISAIAGWLLETGKVDRILATDYDVADKLKTVSRFASDRLEVVAMSGSKYSPSAPLRHLEPVLNEDVRVAVIGRPCDVSTVRLLMKQNPAVAERVVALLSFFCAGTPSDTANLKLLQKLGGQDRDKLVSFKHRGDGWPGFTKAVLDDGQVLKCTYAQSWGGVLNKDLQFGCKICADGIGEAADIVAADAWYGDDDGYPVFGEAEGRSLIMARTVSGNQMLAAIEQAGVLETEDLNSREIDRMQPGQLKRRRYLGVRRLAMWLMLQPTPRYNSQALSDYQKGVRMKHKITALGGTVWRLMKSKWKRKSQKKLSASA